MIRNLTLSLALLAVMAAPVLADHHMEGESPMHPEVILGPPEGFEPPPPGDMEEPPPMDMPPEEMKDMMVEKFFQLMDANGDGVVDLDEFMPWVRGAHMPPPMPGEGDHMGKPMGDHPIGDHMEGGDGILIAGEGDLADLPLAPECSDTLQENEQGPQAEGVPCGDREGNLIFRTICNMPGFERQAISLPDGRAAGCFGLEALRGEISFEIIAKDGTAIFHTSMGKEAFMGLKLDGPGIYEIRSTGGSPDGGVTVRFTDVPMD